MENLAKTCFNYKRVSLALQIKKLELSVALDNILVLAVKIVFSIDISSNAILLKL